MVCVHVLSVRIFTPPPFVTLILPIILALSSALLISTMQTQLVDFLVEDLQGDDILPAGARAALPNGYGMVSADAAGGGGDGAAGGDGEDAENWESIPIWKIPAEVERRGEEKAACC